MRDHNSSSFIDDRVSDKLNNLNFTNFMVSPTNTNNPNNSSYNFGFKSESSQSRRALAISP